MKSIKKMIVGIFAFGLVLSANGYQVAGEELSYNESKETSDQELAELRKQDAEIGNLVKEIYSQHAGQIGEMKKAALEKAGVNSVNTLNPQSLEAIKKEEANILANRQKAIDMIMAKNGYEKQELADEKSSIASTSGDLKLTRNLYKNTSTSTYTYYGYWDWVDGKWDQYVDIADIFAIRSSKDITTRVSAEIYSWDNQGIARHTRVARRAWEADGAIFNVHDKFGYGYGGSMPLYETDNGYAVFSFKAPKGSEIYSHFAHNYKSSTLKANAVFDLIDLSNTKLTVTYSKKNVSWATVSNPISTW